MLQSMADWLQKYGIALEQVWQVGKALGLIILIAIIIHIVLHRGVLRWLRHIADKKGVDRAWTRALKGKLFPRIALLIQGSVVGVQASLWLTDESSLRTAIMTVVALWGVIFSLLSAFSLLDVLEDFGNNSAFGRNVPLRGIIQSLKIIVFIIAALLLISILIGKSPLLLLSGLGAMTAVLMLVFKDPILGLVAGVQLSANKMLNVGDWLEMPKYGADGDVIDISLTTIKVRNWDKTITTVPTYALISDYFKNWKGMTETGGRRIKREILIDGSSVHFLSKQEIAELQQARLLAPYIEEKLEEITSYNKQMGVDDDTTLMNGRRLTNLGCFRIYVERYLRNHPRIRQDLTLMVRQTVPTYQGLPIEVYCFTSTTAWTEYEGIQADIFDHIYAVLSSFNLRIAQAPTGYDMRAFGTTVAEHTEIKQ